ncbi:MAG TPA: hypothetical protein VFW45_10695 [Candidatus Polarisedimenticolia bacterium]|nr:hypothetical protein [Candidatus Polarisedimenticolia bacterium]
MDAAPISPLQDYDPAAEGKAWCPACDAITRFRVEKVEFLGNPVKATCFCIACGTRIFPEAQDPSAARRLRRQNHRLRLQAGAALGAMLILPVLAAVLALWLLLRLL